MGYESTPDNGMVTLLIVGVIGAMFLATYAVGFLHGRYLSQRKSPKLQTRAERPNQEILPPL